MHFIALYRNYTKRKREGGIVPKGTTYLLSGLLHCAQCGAPMSISAGSSAAYYRCQGNRTKNTCPNRVSVREDVARRCVLRAIKNEMSSPKGIAHYRKHVAEELRDYSRNLEARRKERTERLTRTEDKIRGLIEFIATGDRSEYVVATLRDLEAFARAEQAAQAELAEQASRQSTFQWLPKNDIPAHCGGGTEVIQLEVTDPEGTTTESVNIYISSPVC
ncbi:MAG TPA: zinc ribbon domain-containing protein [Kofleriaceae bacterium]|nr:zinc ribbon domain-containing protein [Kofleriaceae bacterium]